MYSITSREIENRIGNWRKEGGEWQSAVGEGEKENVKGICVIVMTCVVKLRSKHPRIFTFNSHPTSERSISIIFNLFLSFSHPKIVIIIISCIEMEFLGSTLCCDSTLTWKSSSTIHDVIRNLSSSFLAKPFFKYLLKSSSRYVWCEKEDF